VKKATKALQEKRKKAEEALPVVDDDVAGEGDEDFETGMRQNAMERDAADADQTASSTSPSSARSCAIARRASSRTRS